MNIVEISERFPRELDAIRFFEQHRWGGDPVCPYCSSKSVSGRLTDYRFKCYKCTKTFSVTVNTFLHDTRLPLKTWLFAFSIITDAKKGLSALQLHRNLNVSYPTAFKMYHTIRGIMAEENRTTGETTALDRMRKVLDRSMLRGQGKRKPGAAKQAPVNVRDPEAIMDHFLRKKRTRAQPEADDSGEIISRVMMNISDEKLVAMISQAVNEEEQGSIPGKPQPGKKMNKIIERVMTNHKKLCNGNVNAQTIESFWTIVRRQIIGQHHHVTARHLPKYVAETVFKYMNRREDDTVFELLVRHAMEEHGHGKAHSFSHLTY